MTSKNKLDLGIVTSTRADYGILRPLIKSISEDPELTYKLYVTGSHLSKELGNTVTEIEQDSFRIHEKVEILMSGDSASATLKASGVTLLSFSEIFKSQKPDLLILLGDRFEIFNLAYIATVFNIPIAHLYGGEVTEGAIDEAFRHSITKMSYFHFTASEVYRKRVIQLGEQPERVFNVGALNLENLRHIQLLKKGDLASKLCLDFSNKLYVATIHPETVRSDESLQYLEELLEALDELKETTIVFTKSNFDPKGGAINSRISDYVEKRANCYFFGSLGTVNYFSLVSIADCVIGNSSSGISEVPYFKTATLNLGVRQTGRIKSESVIDCPFDKKLILSKLEYIHSQGFQESLKNSQSLYGDGIVSEKIISILKKEKTPKSPMKMFYDLV